MKSIEYLIWSEDWFWFRIQINYPLNSNKVCLRRCLEKSLERGQVNLSRRRDLQVTEWSPCLLLTINRFPCWDNMKDDSFLCLTFLFEYWFWGALKVHWIKDSEDFIGWFHIFPQRIFNVIRSRPGGWLLWSHFWEKKRFYFPFLESSLRRFLEKIEFFFE